VQVHWHGFPLTMGGSNITDLYISDAESSPPEMAWTFAGDAPSMSNFVMPVSARLKAAQCLKKLSKPLHGAVSRDEEKFLIRLLHVCREPGHTPDALHVQLASHPPERGLPKERPPASPPAGTNPSKLLPSTVAAQHNTFYSPQRASRSIPLTFPQVCFPMNFDRIKLTL